MQPDDELRAAIYHHLAETTRAPSVARMAAATGSSRRETAAAYRRLAERRLLVLEPGGETIRMAPPFSGIETQHRVRVGGKEYFANCAWDAFGVVAALGSEGEVRSRCEQTLEPIIIGVGRGGPEPEPCVAHFAVPAAHWWDDIVYT